MSPAPRGIALCTLLALIAFAANSVLCRQALGGGAIDAAGFTCVRLGSGALALWLLLCLLRRNRRPRGSWMSAGVLFLYAISFSYAYTSLSAGTGALILFGSVQATMIIAALLAGERPRPLEWGGFLVALTGVVWLVFPGITAPSPAGSLLMALAGFAWGVYSLRGRAAGEPLLDTAWNFIRCMPAVVLLALATFSRMHFSTRGVALAAASGALASGAGYAVWYVALRGLSATRAATVQLSVPVLAGLGGVLLLGETITARLVMAAVLILGGVGVAVLTKTRGGGCR